MSGRRRRDDGWDDGYLGAQDGRHDPWAASSEDGWGDRGPGDDVGRPGASGGGGAAGGYQARGRGAAAAGDRYGAGAGYGGQRERGAGNGPGAAGYNGGGYQDSGYGRPGNGGSRRDAAGYGAAPGGQRSGAGYGGNDRPARPAYAPEFTPADYVDLDEDGPAGTPRPYGRLSIYTLHENKTREFDRLAERAAEGVRVAEPDTLVYVVHVVPKAPMQRIVYEIYRDRTAFLLHERQPHIRQFAADCASCVLATNTIDLRLKYAKVAALGSPTPQANPVPPAQEPVAGGDRSQAAATQQAPAQYQPTQHARPQSPRPEAATFTPAQERYTDLGQPTAGREAFHPAQYGSNSAGGNAAGNAQYGAANVHPGAPAWYANGGSYSGANGYQGPNGNPAPNGYANGGGYPDANGGSNQNGRGYPNGNGYSAASGNARRGSYQSGGGYGAAGGSPGDGAARGPQYTPRYREITSGASPRGGADGDPNDGGRRDGGGQ